MEAYHGQVHSALMEGSSKCSRESQMWRGSPRGLLFFGHLNEITVTVCDRDRDDYGHASKYHCLYPCTNCHSHIKLGSVAEFSTFSSSKLVLITVESCFVALNYYGNGSTITKSCGMLENS